MTFEDEARGEQFSLNHASTSISQHRIVQNNPPIQQTKCSPIAGTDDYMHYVRQEAIQLVDAVLEQSLIMVNSHQNSSNTMHSESEHFAITCDVNGLDIIKSPTIESMSGKSFDDNFSLHDDDIDVVHATFNVNAPRSSHSTTQSNIQYECIQPHDTHTDMNNDAAATATATTSSDARIERIERKFERLSSQMDTDDEPLNSSQCQREFDHAMRQINPSELSDLQRDFSKISWDDSMSATTADAAALTPDNDIQDIPKGDERLCFPNNKQTKER